MRLIRSTEIWMVRGRKPRLMGWWAMRWRATSFAKMHAKYPDHDLAWVNLVPKR